MGTPRSERNRQRREGERYRRAAEAALENLDWVIAYFRRVHKSRLAQALEKNRKEIVRRLQAR